LPIWSKASLSDAAANTTTAPDTFCDAEVVRTVLLDDVPHAAASIATIARQMTATPIRAL